MIIVDGYNVIYKWKSFKKYVYNIDLVRQRLINILSNYQAYTGEDIKIVFDSSVEVQVDTVKQMASNGDAVPANIEVIYAPSVKGADIVVEGIVYSYPNRQDIQVITGDGLERLAVKRLGASVMSPEKFEEEVLKIC